MFQNKFTFLAHQTKYPNMGDQVYFPETVFIWSSLWSKETPIDQSVLQV